MSRDDASSGLFGFLLGAAVGAGAALLLAPRAGKETREKLKDWLDERRDLGEELLAKIKESVPEKKDQVAAAIRGAKQAYQEARHNHVEA